MIRVSSKLRYLAALAFVVGVTSTGVSANMITMENYNGATGGVNCGAVGDDNCLGFTDAPTSLSFTAAHDYPKLGDETAELAALNALLALLDPARAAVIGVTKTDDEQGNTFTTSADYFSIKKAQNIYYFDNISSGELTVILTEGGWSHYTEYGAMSAVPVPAAAWLFGTALIGFIGLSRRTKV
jgi:hypothetical protein